MSLIAVAGGKGAPGATTTATVLAAVWPAPPLLADADPSGGDLAWRLRASDGGWLARDRGVVGLAAAARMAAGPLDVAAYAQPALGGLSVLVGVDSPAQAARIGPSWPAVVDALASAPADVLADCGRILPGLANTDLLARADLVLVVGRANAESVAHLRHTLRTVDDLRPAGGPPRVRVVVVGEPAALAEGVREVAAALTGEPGAPAVHGLAFDPPAAAGLAGVPTRRLDRSRLVSSARRLAADLHAALHAGAPAPAAGRPAAAPVPVVAGG